MGPQVIPRRQRECRTPRRDVSGCGLPVRATAIRICSAATSWPSPCGTVHLPARPVAQSVCRSRHPPTSETCRSRGSAPTCAVRPEMPRHRSRSRSRRTSALVPRSRLFSILIPLKNPLPTAALGRAGAHFRVRFATGGRRFTRTTGPRGRSSEATSSRRGPFHRPQSSLLRFTQPARAGAATPSTPRVSAASHASRRNSRRILQAAPIR